MEGIREQDRQCVYSTLQGKKAQTLENTRNWDPWEWEESLVGNVSWVS